MNRYSKITAIALVALVVCSGIVFAGGQSDAGSSAEKRATLNFMMIGPGKQADSDMVWDLFNQQLDKFLPGTTVKFEIIPGAEYGDRWKLSLSAGEQLDIAGRYWMQNLDVEVSRGALLKLDDLLNEWGPDIKKNMPDWVLAKGYSADGIYEIPCYQIMTAMRFAVRYPKDLSEQYGMKAVSSEIEKNVFMTQNEWDLLEEYLAKAKADGMLRKGVSTTISWLWGKGIEAVGQGGAIEFQGSPIRVFNKYDTEYFEAMIRTQARWYQEGYVRRDVLAMDDPRVDDGKPDGTIAWVHSTFGEELQSQLDSVRYGYPIVVYSVAPYDHVTYGHTATNLGIPSTARYPERAMQVMNLLQSEAGSDMFNLLTWGIEDRHYTVLRESPKKIETIGYAGQGNSDSPYGLWKWAFGNTRYSWLTHAERDDYIETWVRLNDAAIPSQLMGWVPDPNPTKTEEAQIKAVEDEFLNTLSYGALGSGWEAAYEEFLRKLKAAGIDKVIAEYQKQIDAFFAGK